MITLRVLEHMGYGASRKSTFSGGGERVSRRDNQVEWGGNPVEAD